jgi:hypothetical protein
VAAHRGGLEARERETEETIEMMRSAETRSRPDDTAELISTENKDLSADEEQDNDESEKEPDNIENDEELAEEEEPVDVESEDQSAEELEDNDEPEMIAKGLYCTDCWGDNCLDPFCVGLCLCRRIPTPIKPFFR